MRRTQLKASLTILASIFLLACNPNKNSDLLIFSACDSDSPSQSKKEEYSVALNYWLEENSLEGFFLEKQDKWKDSKAWRERKGLIQDEPILKCISEKKKATFLYVPKSYYKKIPIGHEYLKFYLVNNTNEVLSIPSFDNTIGNIRSEISSDQRSWLRFQEETPDPGFICGNSFWEDELKPGEFIEINLESDFLGFGDSTVNYRINFALGEDTLVSNTIPVNLLEIQLKILSPKTEEKPI